MGKDAEYEVITREFFVELFLLIKRVLVLPERLF